MKEMLNWLGEKEDADGLTKMLVLLLIGTLTIMCIVMSPAILIGLIVVKTINLLKKNA